MPYLYIDPWYIILVVPAMLLAFWAQINVNTTFSRYSKVLAPSGMTGAESARRVLEANGVTGVRIERISGNLTDHFDPKTNTIRLSESVYDATTVSAVGVAAHEAGHAVQYAVGYAPMQLRAAIIPATNIGSQLAMPLFLIGLILSSYAEQYVWIAYAGVICYALCLVFQLVTLPTEFNASSRALAAIRETGLLDEEGTKASKKVLSAAAMTYVAAVGVALMSLLRLVMILFGARGRRD